jgi:predicted  nucleic acid-binding Zn-ribbon protein
MKEELTITERIKKIEKEISGAETRAQMHQERISELKLQVQENEKNCKDELNMAIKDLPDYIKRTEIEIADTLQKLEEERDKINQSSEE